MKRIAGFLLTATLLVFQAGPARAQTVTAELIKDLTDVQQKLSALGDSMTVAQHQWRPAAGVRSVGEVLLHVAADNYLMPAVLGIPAPSRTKITATDFPAFQAFERQKLDKAATMAEMKTSFEHLLKAFASLPESRMNEKIKIFGQDLTVRAVLIMTTTHLHEHLGQMIAYARSNGVVPAWSR